MVSSHSRIAKAYTSEALLARPCSSSSGACTSTHKQPRAGHDRPWCGGLLPALLACTSAVRMQQAKSLAQSWTDHSPCVSAYPAASTRTRTAKNSAHTVRGWRQQVPRTRGAACSTKQLPTGRSSCQRCCPVVAQSMPRPAACHTSCVTSLGAHRMHVGDVCALRVQCQAQPCRRPDQTDTWSETLTTHCAVADSQCACF